MNHHLHRIKSWYRRNSNPPWRDSEAWVDEQARNDLQRIVNSVDSDHPKVNKLVRGRIVAHRVSEYY